ncbi:Uncharacterised protein [Actinomyces howellii]|uniref:Uncharacterized protein n=1 Tax=Actinomyces howellii TaxID=52771 RepID=A0A3S4QZL0_9ACTO|nr:Uncharacterised protein [Actinomyces howellii]
MIREDSCDAVLSILSAARTRRTGDGQHGEHRDD